MPHSSIGRPLGRPLLDGAGHRQPGVGHAPAEVGRTLAVVHVAVDALAVDLLDVFGEELGDVLVGAPVHRHAEVIAVLGLELGLEIGLVEPVLAEPVQVRELLVGQLPDLAVRAGGETDPDEVLDVQRRQRHVLAFAGHPVREVDRALQPRVRADQVGVVDVAVVQVAVGLHLRLHRLHDLALTQQLVVDLDAGDLGEGLGQRLGFVLVRRDRFRQHVDLHPHERLGRGDEPLQLLELVFLGQHRGLEFAVDPALGRVGAAGLGRGCRGRRGAGCRRGGCVFLLADTPPV